VRDELDYQKHKVAAKGPRDAHEGIAVRQPSAPERVLTAKPSKEGARS